MAACGLFLRTITSYLFSLVCDSHFSAQASHSSMLDCGNVNYAIGPNVRLWRFFSAHALYVLCLNVTDPLILKSLGSPPPPTVVPGCVFQSTACAWCVLWLWVFSIWMQQAFVFTFWGLCVVAGLQLDPMLECQIFHLQRSPTVLERTGECVLVILGIRSKYSGRTA